MSNYLRALRGALALVLLCGCERIGEAPVAPAVGDGGSDAGPAAEAVCCGCLCRDEHWSCSIETCVDEAGHAVSLAAETGFLEIEQDYPQKEDPADSKIRARVWYAFFPADVAPEDKPLAVFFQGGPAVSVALLLGGNTGPRSLDRLHQDGKTIASNPYSWTSFANLLYLETAQTGFSYLPGDQPEVEPGAPPIEFEPDYDAATFVRVLLRFLARHPPLEDNPVILVGESYGGVRATLMLHQILAPESLVDHSAKYYADPALARELQEHFSHAFGGTHSKVWRAKDIARQFGHQVLIQPALLGEKQEEFTKQLRESSPRCSYYCVSDPPTPDCAGAYYECPDRTPSMDERVAQFHEVLRDPKAHSDFLGVDMTSVAWHQADARRRGQKVQVPYPCVQEPALTAALGELADCQLYYRPVVFGWGGDRTSWGDPGEGASSSPIAELVLHNLKYVHTFVTDAGEDSVVRGDALITTFADTPGVSSAALETRKGARELVLTLRSGDERVIRFPSYPSSGHSVSLYQPRELHRDVESWYLSTEERLR